MEGQQWHCAVVSQVCLSIFVRGRRAGGLGPRGVGVQLERLVGGRTERRVLRFESIYLSTLGATIPSVAHSPEARNHVDRSSSGDLHQKRHLGSAAAPGEMFMCRQTGSHDR
jgi:hypothetical protein